MGKDPKTPKTRQGSMPPQENKSDFEPIGPIVLRVLDDLFHRRGGLANKGKRENAA